MSLLLFILFIITNQCKSFFLNSPIQLNTTTNRYNLTCVSDFSETDPFINCEYCVYTFFNNVTDSIIYRDCISITNSYRLVAERCTGFTKVSDVGYGLCSQLPFEYYDIQVLCICATNLCNQNFTTCQQSVDKNPNLPTLPLLMPSLTSETSTIRCQDSSYGPFNSTYYCIRDSTPFINMAQCKEYVKNHTVLCMYSENNITNSIDPIAIPDEDYEYVLVDEIQKMKTRALLANYKQYYNETKDSFYVHGEEISMNSDNSTFILNKCLCKTNDCNVNLTACLQAMIPMNKQDKNANNRLLMVLSIVFILKTVLLK